MLLREEDAEQKSILITFGFMRNDRQTLLQQKDSELYKILSSHKSSKIIWSTAQGSGSVFTSVGL